MSALSIYHTCLALLHLAGVTRAVACAAKDPFVATYRLVGYVTPADADPAAISSHCSKQLMPAMVPSIIIPMDAFPLLPNGKIDMKSLPAPSWETTAEEYVAPATELEAQLQRIWSVLLGRSNISVTASFFAMGGTSLQVSFAGWLFVDPVDPPSTLGFSGCSTLPGLL